MAIFNSYVSLPEGIKNGWKKMEKVAKYHWNCRVYVMKKK